MNSVEKGQRGQLRALVVGALMDVGVRLILADYLADVDGPFSMRLRTGRTFELVVSALRFGGWSEKELSTRCRGMVRRLAADVRYTRQRRSPLPYYYASPQRMWAVDTIERCHNAPACDCWDIWTREERAYNTVTSFRHIHALVWRGLSGHTVTPDVEGELMTVREEILAAIEGRKV